MVCLRSRSHSDLSSSVRSAVCGGGKPDFEEVTSFLVLVFMAILVDDFLVQNMCLSLIALFVKVIVLRKPLNHNARLIDNLNILSSLLYF